MSLTAEQAEALAGPLCRLVASAWRRRQGRQRAPRFRLLAPSQGRRFRELARRAQAEVVAAS